jgi:hypothetical protein
MYHNLSSYFSLLAFLVYLHQYVYIIGDILLFKFYITDDKIADKLTFYKRRYIIKNLWKSSMLALIMLVGTISLIDGFLNELWSNLTFFIWGTFYVSLDLSGLIYVRGLPIATKVHHIVVCILGTLNCITDYNVSGYYRSILIYTYFSIVPYIVNFYLGYRYLEINDSRRKVIAKISYYVYSLSLMLNIFCQILFFYSEVFSFTILFYLVMFALIMNDDIKLIRFLKNEAV